MKIKLLDCCNELCLHLVSCWSKAYHVAPLAIMICCAFVSMADGQTNQPSTEEFRPFKPIVDAISQMPLQKQREYVLRLSGGLMAEDYAIFTGQSNYPHFGHLARELLVQEKFELMRAMLRGDDMGHYDFFTLAELLAEKNDPETLEILIKHSDLTTPPPKGDEGYKTPEGLVTGEGIPDYAALSLGYYLTNVQFHARVQSDLIKLLKKHERNGTRAFAALALANSNDPEAVKALEEATKDRGRVYCIQCGEDYVSDYAQRALERIKKKP